MFLLFIFIAGLVVGSFLNAVIYRVYKNISLLGRSFCPKCKKKISWFDNLPIISFLFLKGKCRYCRKKISWQYPLVELIMGILAVSSFILTISFTEKFTDIKIWLSFLGNFSVLAVFLIIFVYDFKYYIIPDKVLFPGIALYLCFFLLTKPPLNALISAIYGMAVYVLILGLVFVLTKGKGMGFGDVKLGVLLGMFLKFPLSFYGLVLSFWIGGTVSLFLLFTSKKKLKDKIPFAPFLIISAVCVWFFQNFVLKIFHNFFYF